MGELFVAVVLTWSVIDGDTIRIQGRVWPNIHVEERVRFARIDTPELKKAGCEHAMAENAKLYAQRNLEQAKRIVVMAKGRDDFGRVIGEVWVDASNLNDLLLTSGLARPYGTKGTWC